MSYGSIGYRMLQVLGFVEVDAKREYVTVMVDVVDRDADGVEPHRLVMNLMIPVPVARDLINQLSMEV